MGCFGVLCITTLSARWEGEAEFIRTSELTDESNFPLRGSTWRACVAALYGCVEMLTDESRAIVVGAICD